MIDFYIADKLPTLNEYIQAERSNLYIASDLKRKTEDMIIAFIIKTKQGEAKEPYFITFTWYEKNKKRDKDNVCFAKKFILDAMQKSGVLPNDNNRYITGFKDEFVYGKEQGVLVRVKGADDEENTV